MWKLIIVIFSTILLTQCVKFGPDGRYTCHCLNDEPCNKYSGFCNGGCANGWSGASCQKQNVALNKSPSQVETNRTKRESGDRTTNKPDKCYNYNKTGKWLGIDLEEGYPIKHIIIQPKRDLASVNGILLHVTKENGEPELCYKEGLSSTPPFVKNIECSHVIYGRYVNISNDRISHNGRYLTLCEVEIYVCSVGTFGSDCNNFCHCFNNERCSETGECPNGCSDGWTGTTCSQMCDNGTYGAGCLKLCSDRNCLVETSPCHHIYGSCQGGCIEGFYGEVCDMKCSDRKCKDSNLQCESKTGKCIDGCRRGYQSIDCIQECDNGTYGENCQFKCSERFCQSHDNCSYIDGACDCLDGYQGTDCIYKQSIEQEDNKEIIIGTIVGVIVFVVFVVVIVCVLCKKKNRYVKKNRKKGTESSDNVRQQEVMIG
ncbi:hypothetical protein LOTGIDRAFT_170165 [Lottia gigantea]|uniref:EGF-like domain-containing protein n=1 Tax=Lottia gigantea TaxID=225164 RepID=V3YW59_LOTGI|nr:hypothetical protein LOTGIDRAFT_170165 [Lottia gigantea]ESO82253.1 hypothetical protein LOTGIDRAFT_170165 [Lottia gigantea]